MRRSCAEVGNGIGHHAQHAAVPGDDVSGLDERAGQVRPVDADEADALQLDAAGPRVAQVREHRPGDGVLRRHRVEVGADCPCPVGVGAAQAELGAATHVLCRPVRLAVGGDGAERAREGAVGVGRAGPDVSLVEMRVHVDEAGQHHRARHLDPLATAVRNPAVDDMDVSPHKVTRLPDKAGGDGHVGQRYRPGPDRPEIGHRSEAIALSCHFLSSMWLRKDRPAKMMTPDPAISSSAANMRGMLSR